VGRLSEEKGIIQLLEVFKTLPKIRLVVIGDGPLKKKVNEYKQYSNVKILGFLKREKIYEYMSKSKAVIIPSIWYEVLPIVLLETVSLKVTVITKESVNIIQLSKKYPVLIYKNKSEFINIFKTINSSIYLIGKKNIFDFQPKYHIEKLVELYK